MAIWVTGSQLLHKVVLSCRALWLKGKQELLPRGSGGTALLRELTACWCPQVLLEALYFSLVAKRLHPEEDDTLVEHPFVEHVSEKISKVRPPQGFALFQAKEEARKVKLLHRMLKVSRGGALAPPAEIRPCVGPPSPSVTP